MIGRTAFEWLNPQDPDQVNKLRSFAESFDHELPSLAHPIFIMKRGEEWIGFAQTVHKPVVFTAWKPGVTKPNDVVSALLQFIGWARLQFGGGFTTVSTKQTSFTPEIMAKLGFKRMDLELYEPE